MGSILSIDTTGFRGDVPDVSMRALSAPDDSFTLKYLRFDLLLVIYEFLIGTVNWQKYERSARGIVLNGTVILRMCSKASVLNIANLQTI